MMANQRTYRELLQGCVERLAGPAASRCGGARRTATARPRGEDRKRPRMTSIEQTSTRTYSGCCRMSDGGYVKHRRPSARLSGGASPGSANNSATSSARRRGSTSASATSSNSALGGSDRPANDRPASACALRWCSTLQPVSRASRIPSSDRSVLPMPGSPDSAAHRRAMGRTARESPRAPARAPRPRSRRSCGDCHTLHNTTSGLRNPVRACAVLRSNYGRARWLSPACTVTSRSRARS